MSDLHTVWRILEDRVRADPGAVAVDDRGVVVTYAELKTRADELADRLLSVGLGAGSRLGVLAGNGGEQVVLFFACARLGAAMMPLSWRLTPSELAAQLAHTAPALLFADETFDATARSAVALMAEPTPVVRLGTPLDLPAAPVVTDLPRVGARDDAPLLMMHTAGTMRGPRCAVLTQANCFWTTLSVSRTLEIHRDDVVLSVLPQFHVGAWTIQSLLAWWCGARVVLEPGFEPGRVLQVIAEKQVTTMMAVPSHYLFLAQHRTFASSDLTSLRYAVVGGAPAPEPLLRTWHRRGVPLAQGYGLTEAAPNVLGLRPEEAFDHLGSAGRPYPHVEVAVADPATGERLDGPAEGELLVRGPNVFAGYWHDDEATAFALRDGWLHTGDLVSRDDAGYYRVHDRVDDVFISGGENVSPAEVEAVLHDHRAVADAAVVGRPDEQWGEVGVAFVVLRAGELTDAEQLREHCRERLASFKVPREVVMVDDLPRSGVGKTLRRTLRETAREAR